MTRMPTHARVSATPRVAPRRTRRLAARTPAPAAPIVKWAGGKGRLVGELLARAPSRFRRYYEPFIGGGALFFRLAPEQSVIGDSNADLINMYRCVADDVDAVLRGLRLHRSRHDQDYYYAVRERWNGSGPRLAGAHRAAAFIYLNKTCYNGLWRVNSRGRFNVPIGRYVSPSIYEPETMRSAARVLRGATIVAEHFTDSVADAGRGDFVYFDPPYHPLTKTAKFTSYTSTSFGDADQEQLADLVRELADRGCHVMVSNSDTPFIRRLYRGFRIDRVSCARAINSKGKKRGAVSEVIITSRK